VDFHGIARRGIPAIRHVARKDPGMPVLRPNGGFAIHFDDVQASIVAASLEWAMFTFIRGVPNPDTGVATKLHQAYLISMTSEGHRRALLRD
jgi:hypothetical protein